MLESNLYLRFFPIISLISNRLSQNLNIAIKTPKIEKMKTPKYGSKVSALTR